MSMQKKILVLGIGNLLLSDDGVGVHAVQLLQQEEWPPNVTLMDAGTFTHDIFYLFEGYSHIVVLDIVHAKREPGCIFVLLEKDLLENTSQRLSIHDIDLLDSLRMAHMLHGTKPELLIVGMEPYDYLTWSMELSPVLTPFFPAFVEKARVEIQKLLED